MPGGKIAKIPCDIRGMRVLSKVSKEGRSLIYRFLIMDRGMAVVEVGYDHDYHVKCVARCK